MCRSPQELARLLFAAIEAGDLAAIASLYADDLVTWHSFDRGEKSKSESLALIGHFGPKIGSRHYELIDSVAAPDRTALRFRLTIRLVATAAVHRIDLAVLLTIADDRVSRIAEYIDSRDAAMLLAAVRAVTELGHHAGRRLAPPQEAASTSQLPGEALELGAITQ